MTQSLQDQASKYDALQTRCSEFSQSPRFSHFPASLPSTPILIKTLSSLHPLFSPRIFFQISFLCSHLSIMDHKKSGGKGKISTSKGSQSRSQRAGVQFPIGRFHRYLKKGNYAERIGNGAPVYLAAAVEYLVAEILELAGNAANDNKKSRISPRHLQLAIKNDDELSQLCKGVVLTQGGVLPCIHDELLPHKTSAKKVQHEDEVEN
ncbi:hypothetical protein L596_022439 [Steinernema carpocapsae]|uniref:Histone H2A n=1 Tax=Steinernema carpocapsae TaxID=34508 RepID=A0A4U5MLP6_STECR|nr:hypothetical protein L596_022439 [Steinernema carpocapsae]